MNNCTLSLGLVVSHTHSHLPLTECDRALNRRLCLVASVQSLVLCFTAGHDQRECSLALVLTDVQLLGVCTSDRTDVVFLT